MTHHCCDAMARQVNRRCDQHDDPFDCPDALVGFSARFQEYGLILHDGGTSSIGIVFCPWCGRRLPAGSRNWKLAGSTRGRTSFLPSSRTTAGSPTAPGVTSG
jgi:hypothetical protein